MEKYPLHLITIVMVRWLIFHTSWSPFINIYYIGMVHIYSLDRDALMITFKGGKSSSGILLLFIVYLLKMHFFSLCFVPLENAPVFFVNIKTTFFDQRRESFLVFFKTHERRTHLIDSVCCGRKMVDPSATAIWCRANASYSMRILR